jgi:hypothetical protein
MAFVVVAFIAGAFVWAMVRLVSDRSVTVLKKPIALMIRVLPSEC